MRNSARNFLPDEIIWSIIQREIDDAVNKQKNAGVSTIGTGEKREGREGDKKKESAALTQNQTEDAEHNDTFLFPSKFFNNDHLSKAAAFDYGILDSAMYWPGHSGQQYNEQQYAPSRKNPQTLEQDEFSSASEETSTASNTRVLDAKTLEKLLHNQAQEEAGLFYDIKYVGPKDKAKYEAFKVINKVQVYLARLDMLLGVRVV